MLEELDRIRAEVGSPPLAAPIGQILASQALLNVLSASRYLTLTDELRDLLDGRYGEPPGQVEPTVRRAVELLGGAGEEEEELGLTEVRAAAAAEGLAASEEELLLLGLFGEEAEPLLRTIRGRSRGEESLAAGAVDQARAAMRGASGVTGSSPMCSSTMSDARQSASTSTEQSRPSPVSAWASPSPETRWSASATG